MSKDFELPNNNGYEEAAMPYSGDERAGDTTDIQRIIDKHEARLMSVDGVVGIGIQNDSVGNDVIVIYVRDNGVKKRLPSTLDGLPVQVDISGEIDAL